MGKSSEEVRIGLLGAHRGLHLAQKYEGIPGYRLAAVCDGRADRLAAAREHLAGEGVRFLTDADELFAAEDVDGVFVCVATEVNAELVCRALEAGKHVLCEVPLGYRLEDCWRVVLTVERTGRTFQMAEQTRYWPFVPAWRRMVAEGRLGKVLLVEGQYFHGFPERSFWWWDPDTGEAFPEAEAKNRPRAVPSRLRNCEHPIWYLPHELSPMLHVLDDRVRTVVGMATRRESYVHPGVPISDMELALMHTHKDTILRMAAAFNPPSPTVRNIGAHWYHVKGTKGSVETNRADCDRMKMFLPEENVVEPAQVQWNYNPRTTPSHALRTGHWGADYYPMATFVEAVRTGETPPLDVYTAADTAAPAILAATSAEQGSVPLEAPDFRPGPGREHGRAPGAFPHL